MDCLILSVVLMLPVLVELPDKQSSLWLVTEHSTLWFRYDCSSFKSPRQQQPKWLTYRFQTGLHKQVCDITVAASIFYIQCMILTHVNSSGHATV